MQLFHLSPTLVLVAAFCFSATGCERQSVPSSFVFSDKTESLMKEAQDGMGEFSGVKQLVDEQFGQPESLALSDDLPIDFGGIKGSVVEFKAGPQGTATVKLELKDKYAPVVGRPQPQLQFTSGSAKSKTFIVESWDSDSGTATVSGFSGDEAEAGDKIVMDAGGNLRRGHQIYMQHCLYCHGMSGDGSGTTAKYLWPRPRDFRKGIIKFTSTEPRSKSSRSDFKRILSEGIPGTNMPSFVPLLNDEDQGAVVEYVRFLAMRGEFEGKLATELAIDFNQDEYDERIADEDTREEILEEFTEFMEEDMEDIVDDTVDDLVDDWSEADDEEHIPEIARIPDTLQSRQRGRELYLSNTLKCADCHGAAGKGNGPQTLIFEKHPDSGDLYPESGLHDIWHNVNQPRNLTRGIYRGGRRPVDLYRRIYAGIKGTRMPSFKSIPPEDIWHVVNYTLSIPFEVDPGAPPAQTTDTDVSED